MAIAVMLVLLVLLLGVRPARAQDAGTPAPPPSSRIRETGHPAPPADDIWSHIKFGATMEGYYQYDGNKPDDRVIPLRAYDTRGNVFGLQQAALVVDSAPDVAASRRFGLRLDLQVRPGGRVGPRQPGQRASSRRLSQCLAGLRLVRLPRRSRTAGGLREVRVEPGYETNYAKDNVNFSRAYLFDFLPFYHMGLRTTLPLVGQGDGDVHAHQRHPADRGLQQLQVEPLQRRPQAGEGDHLDDELLLRPGATRPRAARTGPNGWFRVFDSDASIAATRRCRSALDVTHTTSQVRSGDPSLSLDGVGAYARYQVTAPAALAIRYEHLDDEGLFAGVAQKLQEFTATADTGSPKAFSSAANSGATGRIRCSFRSTTAAWARTRTRCSQAWCGGWKQDRN